ncbi:MAG TPA: hypothetical protein VHU14_02845 [Solirubrobacterales bacterium]|nr:hypothetical protein [Solirubrobacterales bacterium]
MSAAEHSDAASTILEATGRAHLADGIAWLAEGHPMPLNTNWTSLLRALVEVEGPSVDPGALRRVTREVSRSDLDTSRVLFATDDLPTPAMFSAAIDALLARSKDGTFSSLTARGVLQAQETNPLAVEALCLAVGVSAADARAWFGAAGSWTEEQLAGLLEYFDELVTGKVESPIPEAIPACAPELMTDGAGWATIDELNTSGVSYGQLLAQRAVNGPWLAHKNKTSSLLSHAVASAVCAELEERGVDFRRSSTVGGAVRQSDLQELSGIPDKRVGLVTVKSNGTPTFAVTFSAARDGGTARANGDGLLQIPEVPLPHAIVLTGLGWSHRHETDRLALRFGGLLFTERNIDDLVDWIEAVTS